ncbi:MAG: glycosyltransferase family 4 protein [Pirellula sp.]
MSSAGKILFVAFGELSKTGCLRAYHLTLELRRLGWDAQIAVPDTDSNRQSPQSQIAKPYFFDPAAVKFRSSVGAILKEFGPDFVHMLNPKEKAFLLASTFPKTRFVFDWEDWTTFMDKPGPVRWYKSWRDRWLVQRADLVISASQWLSQYILEHFGRDSLYLPYACLERQFPAPTHRLEQPIAIGMGSMHAGWDHDLLVEAAGVLKNRDQECLIRWIGSGPELELCRRRAVELGLRKFQFPGYLDWDLMLSELREAHCLVFPIRNKPLNLARCPFKCFQFAQAGRPVIASDVGEVRAILGDKAIYVEPTPEGLADAILNIMQQPRRPDVDYDLSNHRWEHRAESLSARLLGLRAQVGSKRG